MTHERPDEMLDEAVLRRSLRLDADERPQRIDPAAIAFLAHPRLTPAFALGTLVFVAAVAVTAASFWWNAITGGPAVAGAAITVLLDAVALAAAALYPAVEATRDPAVPLSLLVALGIAILYETRSKKERAHAEAS